jgi:hypothetical protein
VSEPDISVQERLSELEAIGELPLGERVSALVAAEAALRDELGRSSGEDTAG